MYYSAMLSLLIITVDLHGWLFVYILTLPEKLRVFKDKLELLSYFVMNYVVLCSCEIDHSM